MKLLHFSRQQSIVNNKLTKSIEKFRKANGGKKYQNKRFFQVYLL